MFETAIALFAAHILADFVLQPDWIVARKAELKILALHTLVVIVTAAVLTGSTAPAPVLLVGALHFIIDFTKQRFGDGTLRAFVADQAAHLASIVFVAWLMPFAFNTFFFNQALAWVESDAAGYLWLLTIFSGFVFTVRAGGFAIGMFMARFNYQPAQDDPGLPDGGYYIGLLERSMIFLLVITNQVAGIGFLVAAKSILRFGATQDRKTGEYVIVGTLASFIWALVVAFLTQATLNLLAS